MASENTKHGWCSRIVARRGPITQVASRSDPLVRAECLQALCITPKRVNCKSWLPVAMGMATWSIDGQSYLLQWTRMRLSKGDRLAGWQPVAICRVLESGASIDRFIL